VTLFNSFPSHDPKRPSTAIKNYADARFERISDPQPVGFGNDDFVFCNWKRIK